MNKQQKDQIKIKSPEVLTTELESELRSGSVTKVNTQEAEKEERLYKIRRLKAEVQK